MAGYRKQHIVPKTYLKQFASQDNFVYVLEFNHQFRKSVQRKGIGHKIFCEENYYDFPNARREPVLEKMFARYESTYNQGLEMLRSKSELGYPAKQLFINWMMMMKSRSTLMRESTSDLVSWIEKTSFGLMHGREKMEEREIEFAKKGKAIGKALQISMFLDDKMYDEVVRAYSANFLNREWTVWHSPNKHFITSDNPGFSYTFSKDLLRLKLSPVSRVYNLNNEIHSAHTFPLTSHLCLTMRPIKWKDDVDEATMSKAFMSNIKFETASEDFVFDVNRMTAQTSHKLVIARSSADLSLAIA
jgi:hypothetical protein